MDIVKNAARYLGAEHGQVETQMVGSAEVMQGLPRTSGVHHIALTPNLKRLEAVMAAG